MQILKPIKRFVRKTKVTMMILHHDPKYSGEIAGSGAIPGVTDGVWGYGEVQEKQYRKLNIRTRDDKEIPPLRLLYGVEGGLTVYDPDKDINVMEERKKKAEEAHAERERICAVFPMRVEDALTIDQIMALPVFENVGEKGVRAALVRCGEPGVYPRLNTVGEGKKGSPFRWFRA